MTAPTEAQQVADLLEQRAITQPFGPAGRVAIVLEGQIQMTTDQGTVAEARRIMKGARR